MTDAEDLPTAGDSSGALPGSADDPTARLLRQALDQQAADVHPDSQALQSIQQRVASPGGRTSLGASAWQTKSRLGSRHSNTTPWFLGAAGAAAATVAVIAAFVVIGNSGGSPSTLPAAVGHQTTQPGGSRNSATSTASPASPSAISPPLNATATASTVPPTRLHSGVYDPNAPASDQVTMYYVGRAAGSGPNAQFRLYPETHTVKASNGSATAAVHEFLTSNPLDGDYLSGWPPGLDVTSISTAGGVTTIALTGSIDPGTHPDPVPFDPSRPVAIQAMLATAGVHGDARFTYNGKHIHLILYESAHAQRQSDYATRAFISITSPVEGEIVRSPVTVSGSANLFEGNLNWDLSDARGQVVKSGHTAAGSMQWKPFAIKLGQLQPGTYAIRAYESSPKNGQPTYVDDKTFTVQ